MVVDLTRVLSEGAAGELPPHISASQIALFSRCAEAYRQERILELAHQHVGTFDQRGDLVQQRLIIDRLQSLGDGVAHHAVHVAVVDQRAGMRVIRTQNETA